MFDTPIVLPGANEREGIRFGENLFHSLISRRVIKNKNRFPGLC